jgi:hypothetical protein
MFDNEIQETMVEQEAQTENDTSAVADAPQQSEKKAAAVLPQFRNTSESTNFIAMRQLKEKAERERDELIREKQWNQQHSAQSPQNYAGQQTKQKFNIAADELAEGKHLQALQEEIAQLREEISTNRHNLTTQTAQATLKATYTDIDKVVTKENLDLLSVQEPELYGTIMSNQDYYAKGVSAYKALKRFGIYQEDAYQPERDQVQQNMNRPRSSNSISPQKGDSPLTQANAFANGLTPELKASLYKEMMEFRRGY